MTSFSCIKHLKIRPVLFSVAAIALATLASTFAFCPNAAAAPSLGKCETLFAPINGVQTHDLITNYRTQVLRLLLGHKNELHTGPVFNMNRTEFDKTPRVIPPLKQESRRALLLRVQRYLYDYEGPQGFARWFSDLTAEVATESALAGELSWGTSQTGFLELEKIVPYQTEYPRPVTVSVFNVAKVNRAALHRVLDRRAEIYGFDRGAAQAFGNIRAPESRHLGVLNDHPDFDVLTLNFFRAMESHALFLDAHFTGQPHGQYPHIFQWLYLADRFTRDSGPGENAMVTVFQAIDFLMKEEAAGEVIIDHPGQKSPSSPNFITQIAKLFLPVD